MTFTFSLVVNIPLGAPPSDAMHDQLSALFRREAPRFQQQIETILFCGEDDSTDRAHAERVGRRPQEDGALIRHYLGSPRSRRELSGTFHRLGGDASPYGPETQQQQQQRQQTSPVEEERHTGESDDDAVSVIYADDDVSASNDTPTAVTPVAAQQTAPLQQLAGIEGPEMSSQQLHKTGDAAHPDAEIAAVYDWCAPPNALCARGAVDELPRPALTMLIRASNTYDNGASPMKHKQDEGRGSFESPEEVEDDEKGRSERAAAAATAVEPNSNHDTSSPSKQLQIDSTDSASPASSSLLIAVSGAATMPLKIQGTRVLNFSWYMWIIAPGWRHNLFTVLGATFWFGSCFAVLIPGLFGVGGDEFTNKFIMLCAIVPVVVFLLWGRLYREILWKLVPTFEFVFMMIHSLIVAAALTFTPYTMQPADAASIAEALLAAGTTNGTYYTSNTTPFNSVAFFFDDLSRVDNAVCTDVSWVPPWYVSVFVFILLVVEFQCHACVDAWQPPVKMYKTIFTSTSAFTFAFFIPLIRYFSFLFYPAECCNVLRQEIDFGIASTNVETIVVQSLLNLCLFQMKFFMKLAIGKVAEPFVIIRPEYALFRQASPNGEHRPRSDGKRCSDDAAKHRDNAAAGPPSEATEEEEEREEATPRGSSDGGTPVSL